MAQYQSPGVQISRYYLILLLFPTAYDIFYNWLYIETVSFRSVIVMSVYARRVCGNLELIDHLYRSND